MTYPPLDPIEESFLETNIEADQLANLAQFGMNMVRLLHDTADRLAIISPIEAAERLPPLTLAFDRMARTVRQTIALQHHLRTATTKAATRTATARRQVIRHIKHAIAAHPEPRERENLLRDLHERLVDPALDEDLLTRPFAEIIEELAHDLGISLLKEGQGLCPRTQAGAVAPDPHSLEPAAPSEATLSSEWGFGATDPMGPAPSRYGGIAPGLP